MPLAQAQTVPTAVLIIDDVVQTPPNAVLAGTTVNYAVTVRESTGQRAFPTITMAGDVVTANFVNTDGQCSLDGDFFCDPLNNINPPSPSQLTYNFALSPPVGTTSFTIFVDCSTCTTGDSAAVTTVVVSNVTMAVDDVATTDVSTPVTIDVRANDSGANGFPISNPSITSPVGNGTAVVNSNGTITYTPSGGFIGGDSFTYSITSGGISDTATVTVIVGALEGPLAIDDPGVRTAAGRPVTINVLGNDVGTDGSPLRVIAVTPPENGGTANINPDNTITYTPAPGFSGTDRFRYTVTDGNAQTSATVTVTVGAGAPTSTPESPGLSTIPGLTGTQRAVARTLDSLCATTRSSLLRGQCANLARLGDEQARRALDEIAGSAVMAQGTNSIETAGTQLTNVRARQTSLRTAGPPLLALQGFSLGLLGQNVPLGGLADAALRGDGPALAGADDPRVEQEWHALFLRQADDTGGGASADEVSRLGGFVNGRIDFGDKDRSDRERGFDFSTQGITIGGDYRFTDKFLLGGAVGYAQTDSDFSSDGGNLETTSTSVSFYGSYYQPGRFFVDWIANKGSNEYDATRHIVFTGVNTRTNGSTDGDQLALSVNVGAELELGDGLLFSPHLRLDYLDAEIDAYQENGGSGLALAVERQDIKSLTSALALEITKALSMRWGVLQSSGRVEWEHEFEDDDRLVTSRFVADPRIPFSISSDVPDRNYFNLGFALSATLPRGLAAFASYETVLGQDTIRKHTIDFGVRKEF